MVTEVDGLPSAESSGLAFWGTDLLTLADSSGNAELYLIDGDGEFARTIPISGASNTDWEDLAVGPCDEGDCAWIADIGDNEGVRSEVTIWRVPLSDDTILAATACPLVYDDGRAHDAEALLWFPDASVRVVTKSSTNTTVYRSEPLRCNGTAQTLTEEVELDLEEPVTGGAVSADGSIVVLRGLTAGWVWSGCGIDWSAEPEALLFVGEDQGEAVTVGADGTLSSSSEGDRFELHELPCTEAEPLVCSDCGCSTGTEPAPALLAAAALALRRRHTGIGRTRDGAMTPR